MRVMSCLYVIHIPASFINTHVSVVPHTSVINAPHGIIISVSLIIMTLPTLHKTQCKCLCSCAGGRDHEKVVYQPHHEGRQLRPPSRLLLASVLLLLRQRLRTVLQSLLAILLALSVLLLQKTVRLRCM